MNLTAWLFNLPYLVYSIIFFFIPVGWAFWLATTDWNLMAEKFNYVGLKNFKKLFSSSSVIKSFWNSYRYMIPIILGCLILGFLIALLVSRLPKKIRGVAAVGFFIPYLVSGTAVAVMVQYVFSYNSNLSNFLRAHFDNVPINILQSQTGFWILVAMVVWKMSGYYALFILSGIESISEEVNEAAELDGCTGVNKLFRITIPMITPTITNVVTLAAGLSFHIFSEPYLLTGGGPMKKTTTWYLEIYNSAFVSFKAGYSSAMAIACGLQIFLTLRLITFLMDQVNHKFGW